MERAVVDECTEYVERAELLESTGMKERAARLESADTGERAEASESTEKLERAKMDECTEVPERAEQDECTEYVERAELLESTVKRERPELAECTETVERADTSKSAITSERDGGAPRLIRSARTIALAQTVENEARAAIMGGIKRSRLNEVYIEGDFLGCYQTSAHVDEVGSDWTALLVVEADPSHELFFGTRALVGDPHRVECRRPRKHVRVFRPKAGDLYFFCHICPHGLMGPRAARPLIGVVSAVPRPSYLIDPPHPVALAIAEICAPLLAQGPAEEP